MKLTASKTVSLGDKLVKYDLVLEDAESMSEDDRWNLMRDMMCALGTEEKADRISAHSQN